MKTRVSLKYFPNDYSHLSYKIELTLKYLLGLIYMRVVPWTSLRFAARLNSFENVNLYTPVMPQEGEDRGGLGLDYAFSGKV